MREIVYSNKIIENIKYNQYWDDEWTRFIEIIEYNLDAIIIQQDPKPLDVPSHSCIYDLKILWLNNS